jgi:HEAT repeat protein
MAGHLGDERTARRGLTADGPETRAASLSALARLGHLEPADVRRALADTEPAVRRRACEVAAASAMPEVSEALVGALSDTAPGVVEAAAYALGETPSPTPSAVGVLSQVALRHPEPMCREAAVAALGALGSPAGLAAVLSACSDKPAVRRRAVVALAAFEGPEVEEALERAGGDADWQVRQAAEDLMGRKG